MSASLCTACFEPLSSHPTNTTARVSTLCGTLLGNDMEPQGLQSVDGRRLLLHPYRRRRADDHLLHAAAATARAHVSHRSGCEHKAGNPTCEGLPRRTYRQHRTIKATLYAAGARLVPAALGLCILRTLPALPPPDFFSKRLGITSAQQPQTVQAGSTLIRWCLVGAGLRALGDGFKDRNLTTIEAAIERSIG